MKNIKENNSKLHNCLLGGSLLTILGLPYVLEILYSMELVGHVLAKTVSYISAFGICLTIFLSLKLIKENWN